jgi:hypothetical protein
MWWWVVASAVGGTRGYQVCCAAAGGTACPTEIHAAGPGTQATTESGVVRLTGIWKLSCDGRAGFDKGATQVVATMPVDGTVLTPMAAKAAECFEAACSIPAALCLHYDGERSRVIECATGNAAPSPMWQTSSAEDTRAVVVSGRVLAVRTASASAAAPVAGARVYQANQPSEVLQPPPTVASPIDTRGWDLSVPPEPPDPCRGASGLRDASASQVDAGDEAAMQGDYKNAIARDRAAISINSCNAFAWAAMGEAFLAVNEHPRARTTLTVATRLMPNHYQAWTNLGKTEEAMGRYAEAADAYRKALKARAGYPPAEEGLLRTQPR